MDRSAAGSLFAQMLDQELLEEPQCMRRLGSRPVVSPECAVLS